MNATPLRFTAGIFCAGLLLTATALSADESPPVVAESVTCEGEYTHHLQGICKDRVALYWCFTTTLVKTDLNGKVLKQVPVANHHGDLCVQEGRVSVAVNLGLFNDPAGRADSAVYTYDAQDLSLLSKHPVPEVKYGAGGIAYRDGHFFVVGGLPADIEENYIYEYDAKFQFQKQHVIRSGQTHLGIQTVTFANDRWWFGCYGDPAVLLVTGPDFELQGRYPYDCSLGLAGLGDGQFFSASNTQNERRHFVGRAQLVVPDAKAGLKAVARSLKD